MKRYEFPEELFRFYLDTCTRAGIGSIEDHEHMAVRLTEGPEHLKLSVVAGTGDEIPLARTTSLGRLHTEAAQKEEAFYLQLADCVSKTYSIPVQKVTEGRDIQEPGQTDITAEHPEPDMEPEELF